MMNKLFVFGDSFSAPYTLHADKYREYLKYLKGGPFPKTWAQLLAEKLNLELVCLGVDGACNYTIFDKFCESVDMINENDLVIIGWSFVERFRIYDKKIYKFRTLVPQFTHHSLLDNMSENTINEIFYNRSDDYWAKEVKGWEKVILRLQKAINFKLFIWSFEDKLSNNKINLHYIFSTLGAETILQETNEVVDDRHYGKKGHIVQSNCFYEKIIQMDSSNYIRL